jgi:hypothetical protein
MIQPPFGHHEPQCSSQQAHFQGDGVGAQLVCSVNHSQWQSLTLHYARGEPLTDAIPRPDLILAADCVYYEPAFPLLVQTLSNLINDEKTEALFCYKKRRKVEPVSFL